VSLHVGDQVLFKGELCTVLDPRNWRDNVELRMPFAECVWLYGPPVGSCDNREPHFHEVETGASYLEATDVLW
jgi:hypothetical protein